MQTPKPQRVLIVSNGHGEDAIAAQLIAALPGHFVAEAYPMIGAGSAYAGICPIVGPRASVASEGWRNVKGSLRRDVATGGLAIIPPALKFFAAARKRYDRVIVVGDMVGVLAGLATGHRDLFYIDVYKTGAARLYSALERWAIKRTCTTVFCRSDSLAQPVRAIGVDARSAGNLMMDTIPSAAYDTATRREHPLAIALLPGSRALTAESFALQISALRLLPPQSRPDIFVAVAGSVAIDDLAQATGLTHQPPLTAQPTDLGQLTDANLTVHLARGSALGNLLTAADVVLSQAGTASVQALGLGKPVITFVQPRDRRSRFTDEQALFGPARTVTTADPEAIATALQHLLANTAERARLGTIGRKAIGGPGAMAAIIAALQA